MGSDGGVGRNTSPYRKFSGGRASTARSPDWRRSYGDEGDSPVVVGTTQRFEIDPNVPLEEMTVVGGGPSDETESSDGGQVR